MKSLFNRVKGRKHLRNRVKEQLCCSVYQQIISILLSYTCVSSRSHLILMFILFNLASFLIPYFIILAAEGMPLYYMELCLGQRLRKGSIGVWNVVSPYLDGIGYASVVICIMVCLYYNVILSWCLIYLANSFKSPLPWSQCPTTTVTIGKIIDSTE